MPLVGRLYLQRPAIRAAGHEVVRHRGVGPQVLGQGFDDDLPDRDRAVTGVRLRLGDVDRVARCLLNLLLRGDRSPQKFASER